MRNKLYSALSLLLILFISKADLYAQPINDECSGAIDISSIIHPEEGFYSIPGTTTDALSESFINTCGIGDFPTVWYKFHVLNELKLNFSVISSSIFSPSITLYSGDCSLLIPEELGNTFSSCVTGTNGSVLSINTIVEPGIQYYLAVTSSTSLPGDFTLSVSGVYDGSYCVTDAEIRVVERSEPGNLWGPFKPGERIKVAFDINNYTAADNGCQWFQGIVPTFGNGWEPATFDINGQPENAMINGNPIGLLGNGLYGASTWDWFTDVDYHYDHHSYEIGDFDGNGTLDLCNSLYDANCSNTGGITGGCCGPCWGTPIGTILPGGWFAYGINGTCGNPGPPIAVDWGDGNSCGFSMGPWRFTFDLLVREREEIEEGYNKFSIGFKTFADGEVGSWSGNASVCALDDPQFVEFDIQIRSLGRDTAAFQTGNRFSYVPDVEGMHMWTAINLPDEINLEKAWTNNGEAMIFLLDSTNQVKDNYEITLVGVPQFGFGATLDVKFELCPAYTLDLPREIKICKNFPKDIHLVPAIFSNYNYQWLPGEETSETLSIPALSNLNEVSLKISNAKGCTYFDTTRIVRENCTILKSNEGQTKLETVIAPALENLIENRSTPDKIDFTILPNPANESILIDWGGPLEIESQIEIYNLSGQSVKVIQLEPQPERRVSVDISHFAEGMYTVVMTNARTIQTKRLIKI